MTMYRYRAVDTEGQPVEGDMEERSAHRVTQKLRERGLTVNAVEELHKERGLLRISTRLTWEELQVFSEQLAAIARSELPMAPALKALSADLQHGRLKQVLHQLQADLERGVSLDEAIVKQHTRFPRLYPSILRAGEATGNLAGVLQLLCSYSGRMTGLKNTLQIALTYPFVVCCAAAVVLWLMMVKIVPVYAEIFQEFGGEFPGPTKVTLKASDLIVRHWPNIAIGISLTVIGLVLLRRLLRRSDGGRAWLDWLYLHIPLVGRQHYLMSLVHFCRTLALLLSSRVPVIESLELAAAASDSPQLQRAVEEASLQVAGGERIADSLGSTGFFGHNFCWLLATGEARGEADLALDSLAATFEREVSNRDRALSVLAAPVLIICLGFLIGFVVVSLYLPIFSLSGMISGV